MAVLLQKRKWDRQPTGAVEPDFGNPLFRSLAQLLNPCDPSVTATGAQVGFRNYANSAQSAQEGGGTPVPRKETQAGVCYLPSSTGFGYSIGAADPNARLPWTYFGVLSLSSVASNLTIATIYAGGSYDRQLICYASGLPNFRGDVYDGSHEYADGATKIVANRPYKVVLSCTSSLQSLWVDGKLDATKSVSNAGYNGYSGTTLLQFGSGQYSVAGSQIALFGRLNNYAWGQDEVSAWGDYPYQVWKLPRRMWIPKITAVVSTGLLNMGASSGGAGWVENKVNAVGAAS